ncbi:MAG: cysteine desulfurase [Clostridia bacterium]|nr:cysteine desulfurase [Clostridia bacterium]
MRSIYLDNSATTAPCEQAVAAVLNSLTNTYANPSSLYSIGVEANRMMEQSRENIAKFLGCSAEEIFFTSGGTEANNIALQGAFYAGYRNGNKVVTTATEHPSVLNTLKELCRKHSAELVEITPDATGAVSKEKIFEAIDDKTFLVSIMLVNNEVGAINPVAQARTAIARKNSPALLHSDCVQAFGKLKFSPKTLGVDLLTVSGHKVHGPKGVGALYVKKGVRLSPTVFGGGQEKGIRPGTQATAFIDGFSAAVSALRDENTDVERICELRDYAVEKLSALDDVFINSSPDALPYILNISVLGYRSEVMLRFLSGRGVFVSSGSACSKGKRSYVLTSMGVSPARIDSALRISFSRYSQKSDIDALVEGIAQGQANLLKSK